MPEILEKEQSIRVPTAPPTRSRAIEFTLAILGFLCLGPVRICSALSKIDGSVTWPKPGI